MPAEIGAGEGMRRCQRRLEASGLIGSCEGSEFRNSPQETLNPKLPKPSDSHVTKPCTFHRQP